MKAIFKSIKFYISILVIVLVFLVVAICLVTNPVFFVESTGLLVEVDKEGMESDVRVMTSVEPARNYKNIDSLNMVASWIEDRFSNFDCGIEIQKYKIDGVEYKNISCLFGLESAPRVVVGAHYDVFGEQAGADDNASGVAAMLELARLIDINKGNLKNRYEFVAYTLEEPPFFKTASMGSKIHADSLYFDRVNVKAMISLEMIGYYSDEEGSQTYPSALLDLIYPNTGNFIAVVGRFGHNSLVRDVKRGLINTNIEVRSINSPKGLAGVDMSDHSSYWDRHFNAVMVTDTSYYRNKNYHKKTDTIETLNFDKMAEVVRGVYYAIIEL